MQDMYVGDIGDYGKYGLLRALYPEVRRLGIVWYLVRNESHLNDGKYVDYLSKDKYRDCDPELFLILKKIVSSGERAVSSVERSGLFPGDTIYYSDLLSYEGSQGNRVAGREERKSIRKDWLNQAIETVNVCDAIFLDPDNGLESAFVKKHYLKAPKYVFYDEIKHFLDVTDTLIIYHHLNRLKSHIEQIKHKREVLSEQAGGSYNVISLRFKAYSPRIYFIITRKQDIIQKVEHFITTNWSRCFEWVGK